MTREVYGRVYELVTMNPRDGKHPYVGKTVQTLMERVHTGRNPHTGPASVAKAPWKARVLPGALGFRLIEEVYSTGDPVIDAWELSNREAYWIRRLKATHNQQRPVYQRHRPRNLTAPRRRPRRRPLRPYVFAALFVALTALCARAILSGHPDNAASVWVAAPALGFLLAALALGAVDNFVRWLTRPPRRRRR